MEHLNLIYHRTETIIRLVRGYDVVKVWEMVGYRDTPASNKAT